MESLRFTAPRCRQTIVISRCWFAGNSEELLLSAACATQLFSLLQTTKFFICYVVTPIAVADAKDALLPNPISSWQRKHLARGIVIPHHVVYDLPHIQQINREICKCVWLYHQVRDTGLFTGQMFEAFRVFMCSLSPFKKILHLTNQQRWLEDPRLDLAAELWMVIAKQLLIHLVLIPSCTTIFKIHGGE